MIWKQIGVIIAYLVLSSINYWWFRKLRKIFPYDWQEMEFGRLTRFLLKHASLEASFVVPLLLVVLVTVFADDFVAGTLLGIFMFNLTHDLIVIKTTLQEMPSFKKRSFKDYIV